MPAPPVPPSSSHTAQRLEQDVVQVKSMLHTLVDEVRRLREVTNREDSRAIHIHRVDHMDIEQLYHVIGRLAVDKLDGTLNVGFSRNLRVNPRLPGSEESPRPAKKNTSRPS